MINGKTKLLCLLGSPVSHSFSPLMHNAACERLELNASYLAFDIERDKIQIALEGLKSMNFIGCNVTSPYKVEVMPYLNVIDPIAKEIGAVNTIAYKNHQLIGYNTDVEGFIESFKQRNIPLENKKIAVLGSGGASKAVIIGLKYQRVKSIDLYSRTINESNNDWLTYKNYDNFDYDAYDIIVNCTPLGMGKHIKLSPIDTSLITRKDIVLYDLIYNPYETVFLKNGPHDAIKINGLDMLIHQGIFAYKYWFEDIKLHKKWEYDDVFKLLVEHKIIDLERLS
ncbi:MAG: shikimate dehydrogenase [Clostridia bacterium]|nr:shikimate dehydrogenase [Clostridia bacterium]